MTEHRGRVSNGDVRLLTRSADETRGVGAAIAQTLAPGDVVALTGELGAGKTCLVQGAAAALGVKERVTSPSFLLRRDYRGTMAVIHIDVYRLDTLQEVMDIGYDEVGEPASVAFIEWGDAMAPLLPADHLEVELRLGEPAAGAGEATTPDAGADAEQRMITLRAHGDAWRRRVQGLAAALAEWRQDEDG